MIVLTRHIGERLYIGTGITIKVLGIEGQHVCIGIDAPQDKPVEWGKITGRKRHEDDPTAPIG